jgi:tetratricopeptide (TPR) repeat protein
MKRSAMVLAFLTMFYTGWILTVHASGTSTEQMKASNSGDANSSNSGDNSSTTDVSAPVVSLYDQGLAASKSGDFSKAIDYFQLALQSDPNNADVLNELAHAQRKNGDLDNAIENYWKALKIRPDFPEAREYLGEAYLQGAVQQAKLLKAAGAEGDEQLEDLTKALQDADNQIKSSK